MQTFDEQKAEVKAEQENLTREEVAEMLASKNEYVFDPDAAKPIEHRWVDRGLVMSCEGAMHPNHRAFKRK